MGHSASALSVPGRPGVPEQQPRGHAASPLSQPGIRLRTGRTRPSEVFYDFQKTVTERFCIPAAVIGVITHKVRQPDMTKASLFVVSLRRPLSGSGQLPVLMGLVNLAFQVEETQRVWKVPSWSVQPRV